MAHVKICIFGAGAIGGYLAVRLKQGGAEVSVVARGANLDAIRTRGLTLLERDGESRVDILAASDPAELGEQDYVIVALKAHQAWEAAVQMRPLLGPETAVVTAQNGLPWWYFHGLEGSLAGTRLGSIDPENRQFTSLGPERAIGCVVFAAAELLKPGVIKYSNPGSFTLGEPGGAPIARTNALAEAFSAGGLTARVHPKIREEIWLKLWGNLCLNPISALTHATLDVIATEPGSREVCRSMMGEAEEIARRLGVMFPMSADARLDRSAGMGAHRTSMLQDLLNGRAIELDALLTVVQEVARIVRVSTPIIDTVLALTRQMGQVAGVYPAFPPNPGRGERPRATEGRGRATQA